MSFFSTLIIRVLRELFESGWNLGAQRVYQIVPVDMINTNHLLDVFYPKYATIIIKNSNILG